MWDLLKKEIKVFTVNYSREGWHQLSWEKITSITRLSFLKHRLVAGCLSVKDKICEIEPFLNQFFARQLKGSKIGSRV